VFGKALRREATDVADLDALIDYLGTFAEPVRAPRDARLRPASR
jgi:hypothetical protein